MLASAATDRDLDDLDMGFGGSRFVDQEDDDEEAQAGKKKKRKR